MDRDPVGAIVLIVSVPVSLHLFLKRNDVTSLCFGLGIIIQFIYVLRVGGDFMRGRFFTTSILMACVILCKFNLQKVELSVACIAIILIAITRPYNNFFDGASSDYGGKEGIVIERNFYGTNWLLNYSKNGTFERFHFYRNNVIQSDKKVFVTGSIGMLRQALPLTTHIVDVNALSEPFLARIPAPYNNNWRAGHLSRSIPAGYLETLETGINVIADEKLRVYYDALHEVISGELFSLSRLKKIVYFNLGKFDYLIDFDRYRYPRITEAAVNMDISRFSDKKTSGSPWDAKGNTILDARGVRVNFGEAQFTRTVELSLDGNDNYDVAMIRDGKVVAIRTKELNESLGGMHIFTVNLTGRESKAGFDNIVVVPYDGDGAYSVGHIIIG
jgi:arabinofuranosyltransferase